MSIKHTPVSLTTNNISLPLEVRILKKENIEFIPIGSVKKHSGHFITLTKSIITYNNINNNNNIFL